MFVIKKLQACHSEKNGMDKINSFANGQELQKRQKATMVLQMTNDWPLYVLCYYPDHNWKDRTLRPNQTTMHWEGYEVLQMHPYDFPYCA